MLNRGAQHALGWLVASCHDDDGVDRIVRPQADWLGASHRIDAGKLWIYVKDGDRAAAELLAHRSSNVVSAPASSSFESVAG